MKFKLLWQAHAHILTHTHAHSRQQRIIKWQHWQQGSTVNGQHKTHSTQNLQSPTDTTLEANCVLQRGARGVRHGPQLRGSLRRLNFNFCQIHLRLFLSWYYVALCPANRALGTKFSIQLALIMTTSCIMRAPVRHILSDMQWQRIGRNKGAAAAGQLWAWYSKTWQSRLPAANMRLPCSRANEWLQRQPRPCPSRADERAILCTVFFFFGNFFRNWTAGVRFVWWWWCCCCCHWPLVAVQCKFSKNVPNISLNMSQCLCMWQAASGRQQAEWGMRHEASGMCAGIEQRTHASYTAGAETEPANLPRWLMHSSIQLGSR